MGDHLGVKILVDHRERASRVPAALEARGVEIECLALPLADYVVAPGVAVERKTVSDLHRSIASGRLWTQVASLTVDVERPYLLIEGHALDHGPISETGLRGALLEVINLGIPVLWSADARGTAVWLEGLARRAHRGRVRAPRRSRPRQATTDVALLASMPGISDRTARLLLRRFGTISAIARAQTSELIEIPYIGSHRAETIRTLLNGPPS